MKRRNYIISIALIVIVMVGLVVYFGYSSIGTESPASTPPLLYTPSVSPQIINASQGSTQQVNLTLTSICSTKIEIPIEALTINGYTIGISDNVNASSPWSTSVQEDVFNYSFSLNQLILQPFKSNSTIITINLTDSFNEQPTTLGSYSLDISFGKIIFLSPPSKYDISYSGGFPIVMILAPSANLVSSLTTGEYPSSPPPNLLNISGNVTNTGETTAYNAGLHVVAYTSTGTVEINVTVPLAYDETFNQDFGTGAVGGGLIGGSYTVTELDSGQTVDIFSDIYHEGTVTNWTVTPVWTNTP
jgi:hypothetical protein